jgi:hypothetical protein
MQTAAATPLSTAQERRLVEFLEEQFLELTRGYKKRLIPRDSFRCPRTDAFGKDRSHPSSALTTLSAYLEASHHLLNLILQIPPIDPSTSLRNTLLLRLTGEIFNSVPGYAPDEKSLEILLDWLQDLDRGWLAVLRSQGWDSEARAGVSVRLPNEARSGSLSQTERIRLKSLLVTGVEAFEEWVGLLHTQSGEGEAERFGDLFSGTLTEMGILRGEFSI